MEHRLVIGIILIFVSPSYALTCDRIPKKAEKPTPNIDKYVIEITGNPEKYSPEQTYQIVLKTSPSNPVTNLFTKFMLVVEPLNPTEVLQTVKTGDLLPIDPTVATFTPKCPNTVVQTNDLAKSRVEILWKAPPKGNGCVAIKATVFESPDSWFTDDNGLTRPICEEEENEDVQPPILESCDACDEAKYEIAFQGLWTRNTHPKDFPANMWATKFSDVIGASHKFSKSFWNYNDKASDGLKLLAEEGNTTALEDELKEMVKSDDIRTIIKARELSYPNITGTSYTVFRVDKENHLISLVSKITPSPDWIVGVANLELCLPNGSWVQSRSLNLYPWDVGTDDGTTYQSPDSPSATREDIRQITSLDENSPFYGETLNPLAKLKITRQKVYEKECPDEGPCKLNDWSDWSECSAKCGQGTRTRSRDYANLENKEECMKNDPQELEESETCEGDCNGVDCSNAIWGEWSECSKSCGTGTRQRTGKPPSEEEEIEEIEELSPCVDTEPCFNPECETPTSDSLIHDLTTNTPINCVVSDWSDWKVCDGSECAKGFKFRDRQILVRPRNGGKACPRRLRKVNLCQNSNCEELIDCIMGPWSPWTPCSSNCGSNAVQQRTRNILRYPAKGGKACGAREETRNCRLPYACNDREFLHLVNSPYKV